MKAYIVVWQKSGGLWSAESDIWPTRALAEARLTLAQYRNSTIIHQVCEVEVVDFAK